MRKIKIYVKERQSEYEAQVDYILKVILKKTNVAKAFLYCFLPSLKSDGNCRCL